MPLPSLDNFTPTIKDLHQAAILLAPINSALKTHQANAQHLPLEIRPFGLRSAYPKGSSIVLNFKTAKLTYYRPNGIPVEFPLADYQQSKLFETLLTKMREDELKEYLVLQEGQSLSQALVSKLVEGDKDKTAERLRHYQNEEQFVIDTQISQEYGEVLYSIFTGMARFKARLSGAMSPLIVWPEHFDLSMLWFANEQDESKPHINIGFAPYTPNHYEKPYLYAYAHPYPQGFTMPLLEEPLQWEHNAYKGIYIPYEAIARQEHPEQYVEQMCLRMFEILQRVL